MKKAKRVLYSIECAYDPSHVFEKVFKIEDGSEDMESEVQAYCPYCQKHVTTTIKGKAPTDESLLREFDLEAS